MASFEWFVSLRYLRAKREQKFISLITVISMLGVAVGVLALIVVLSVYTGFTEGLRDQIIGINGHAIIQQRGGPITSSGDILKKTRAVSGVVAATPYVYAQVLISSADKNAGVAVRGIEPETAVQVMNIEEKLIQGGLVLETGTAVPGVVLGLELANKLRVTLHSKVRLLSPNGSLSPMGVLPKIRTCTVMGIFETGMYEYDANIAFVSLDTARSLAGLSGSLIDGIEVRVQDIDRADLVAHSIADVLGQRYAARDWMQLNQNLFAALKLEKAGIFIALDLIILVAAFNIISALIMVVMEKNRDIAILKSMGATTRSIMKIFFYQGAIIGVFGTVLGVFSGLILCWVLQRYEFIELPSNVYPMSTMPVKVVPMDITLIACSAILITLLATLYPSWKASRVRPAEALTYE